MPTYVQPTADDIRRLTGVDEQMDRLTTQQLTDALTAPPPTPPATTPARGLVWDAETETALNVGLAIWDSATLSQTVADALTQAVGLRTGAQYYRTIAGKKVAAGKQPHVMEDAAQILAVAESLEAKAAQFEELARGQVIEEPTNGTGEMKWSGRARFAVVTPLPVTVPPSDRIRINDPRRDLPPEACVP